MYLIDSDGATNDNKFTDGDPGTGTVATVLPAEYLNMLQDELAAVIAAAEIELDKGTNDQLMTALTTLGLRSATTAVRGVVELATSTETLAGADSGRSVTPAGLAALTATESRRGLVELASLDEVAALSDLSRGISPGRLSAAFPRSLGSNGWQELAGGLLLQWTTVSRTSSGQTVYFPTAFPSACVGAFVNLQRSADADDNVYCYGYTTTHCTVRSGTTGYSMTVFALGY